MKTVKRLTNEYFFRTLFIRANKEEWRVVFSNKFMKFQSDIPITNNHIKIILKEFIEKNYKDGDSFVFILGSKGHHMLSLEADKSKKFIFIKLIRTNRFFDEHKNDNSILLDINFETVVKKTWCEHKEIEKLNKKPLQTKAINQRNKGLRIIRKAS